MPATISRTKPPGYQAVIQAATGAQPELLPALERILRREVFHSTLDWLSAAQLACGSRQALALYRGNSAFYDAETARLAAYFTVAQAEQALAAAQAGEDAATFAEAGRALAQAQAALDATDAAFDGATSTRC